MGPVTASLRPVDHFVASAQIDFAYAAEPLEQMRSAGHNGSKTSPIRTTGRSSGDSSCAASPRKLRCGCSPFVAGQSRMSLFRQQVLFPIGLSVVLGCIGPPLGRFSTIDSGPASEVAASAQLFVWAFGISVAVLLFSEYIARKTAGLERELVHDKFSWQIPRPFLLASLGIAAATVLIDEAVVAPYGILSKICLVGAGALVAGETDIVLQYAKEKGLVYL